MKTAERGSGAAVAFVRVAAVVIEAAPVRATRPSTQVVFIEPPPSIVGAGDAESDEGGTNGSSGRSRKGGPWRSPGLDGTLRDAHFHSHAIRAVHRRDPHAHRPGEERLDHAAGRSRTA